MKMKRANYKTLISILFIISIATHVIDLFPTQNLNLEKSTTSKMETTALSATNTWLPDGTAICTADNRQYEPRICSDGVSGAIITWADKRTGHPEVDIYAQRINSLGNVQWTANGVAICTTINSQEYHQICSDGVGGAIITWRDYRTGFADIYAQKVNSSGNVQWSTNGVAICTANNEQTQPQICSDEAGGAIITWQDYRGGLNDDIYTQRINSSGNVQWTVDGVAICTVGNGQYEPQICSDSVGGAIITWFDYRSGGPDIYAQKVDASGNVQWTVNGVGICTVSNIKYYPQICGDDAGGAIITWQDNRSVLNYDIYAQKVDTSGNVQWTFNGVTICTANNSQEIPQIYSNGAGGAIITWEDYRSGSNYDVYSQLINSSGNVQWTVNGIGICTANNEQLNPKLCNDGAGGAIITWEDYRSGSNYDVYSQLINSSGNVQWTADGVAICNVTDRQSNPNLCTSGEGGAIITWQDRREGVLQDDIYALLIRSTNGNDNGDGDENGTNGGKVISFEAYYLIFVTLAILYLLIHEKHQVFRKSKL